MRRCPAESDYSIKLPGLAWGGQIFPYTRSAALLKRPDDSTQNIPAGNGHAAKTVNSYVYNYNLPAFAVALAGEYAPANTVLATECRAVTAETTIPGEWSGLGFPPGGYFQSMSSDGLTELVYEPDGNVYPERTPARDRCSWRMGKPSGPIYGVQHLVPARHARRPPRGRRQLHRLRRSLQVDAADERILWPARPVANKWAALYQPLQRCRNGSHLPANVQPAVGKLRRRKQRGLCPQHSPLCSLMFPAAGPTAQSSNGNDRFDDAGRRLQPGVEHVRQLPQPGAMRDPCRGIHFSGLA